MIRYVLIETNNLIPFAKVLQFVDAEQMPSIPPGASGFWVETSVDTPIQIGWKAEYTVNGWVFSEPTYQDQVDIVANRVRFLLGAAEGWLMLNPLQYKLDMGIATPEEQASLLAYKQYYVAVCEVKTQSGYPYTVTWPVAPF
ncbi:phage tail protein [Pseudomonas sp. 91RF]|uniref:tail fiber assembly protein n=1 Tax=Pseudomonas sp. 91RF TaxID=2292261 RepID=UPI000E662B9B|nr:tail fiber assembly protein [Pseudomonas sp. 91RF]RIJ11815.1 phage tail protein [Pseudomonas sp. 91RF]